MNEITGKIAIAIITFALLIGVIIGQCKKTIDNYEKEGIEYIEKLNKERSTRLEGE